MKDSLGGSKASEARSRVREQVLRSVEFQDQATLEEKNLEGEEHHQRRRKVIGKEEESLTRSKLMMLAVEEKRERKATRQRQGKKTEFARRLTDSMSDGENGRSGEL